MLDGFKEEPVEAGTTSMLGAALKPGQLTTGCSSNLCTGDGKNKVGGAVLKELITQHFGVSTPFGSDGIILATCPLLPEDFAAGLLSLWMFNSVSFTRDKSFLSVKSFVFSSRPHSSVQNNF